MPAERVRIIIPVDRILKLLDPNRELLILIGKGEVFQRNARLALFNVDGISIIIVFCLSAGCAGTIVLDIPCVPSGTAAAGWGDKENLINIRSNLY